MNVAIGLTLPTDYIGTTSVTSKILSAYNDETLLSGSSLSAQFGVLKPTGTTATGSTLISFGVDPTDATKIGLGVAIYSNTFCHGRTDVLMVPLASGAAGWSAG